MIPLARFKASPPRLADRDHIHATAHLDGEAVESADVMTYNGNGKLVAFATLGEETVINRVFAK
jgi:hypothetical protein